MDSCKFSGREYLLKLAEENKEMNNMADTVKFDSVRRWNGSEYNTWKMIDVCGRRKNLKAGERLMLARRVSDGDTKSLFPVWRCEKRSVEVTW